MCKAVYNSAISDAPSNSVCRAFCSPVLFRVLLLISLLTAGLCTLSAAADWNTLEQNLAQKIVAVTGPGRVAVTLANRTSLSKRGTDIIENGLRSALENAGVHFAPSDQASASVTISLSENPTSYVWVAEIRPSAGNTVVVLVSTPRPDGLAAARDSVPLSLRKIPLYAQVEPILDVAVLEESFSPTRIAVLDPEKVSLYRMQNGRWQPEQTLAIIHELPWPRDLRGRLIVARDHLLDVYLPGVYCTIGSASPYRLDCRQSDDPWPLLAGALNGPMAVFPSAGIANGASTVVEQVRAFFAPARNFFTGVLTPGVGSFNTVPKFFSAALLPRENSALWFFAGTDSHLHIIDGTTEQTAKVAWGSDLASVKTACGAGWQILASSAGEQADDSIRAYEFPDRDPVAVSPEVDFDGAITALWTEARGDTAVVVSRNRDTGNYEAFRLAMACGQ